MGFLSKLFSKKQSKSINNPFSQDVGKPAVKLSNSKKIEISNSYGHYDSSPLIVEEHPDLEKLFNNPPIVQKLSNANKDYWEKEAGVEDKRMTLAIAYLQHPNPQIRKDTLTYVRNDKNIRISQVLVDLLGGSKNRGIRADVAKCIWEREKANNCKFTVGCLKDEVNYGSERSIVGPTRAREALNVLIQNAPTVEARKGISLLING